MAGTGRETGDRMTFDRKMLTRVLASIQMAAVAGLCGHEARAADVPASGALEEIIVTARKRSESLQDTPVAVTAFTAEALASRAITNIQDIGAFVPNFQFQIGGAGGSGANFYIRGVGMVDFIASTDPGVGTYVDGVYLGRTSGGAFDLLDVDHVEVLRGPQGTLFGRNTVGGAVSVITAKPDDGVGGMVQLEGGSFDRYGARAIFNLPLVEGRLLSRASLHLESKEGYTRRLVDGARAGDRDTTSGRLALRYLPSDALTVDVAGDYQKVTGTVDATRLLAFNPILFPGGRRYVSAGRRETYAGIAPDHYVRTWGTSLTAEYAASPFLTMKSILAYRELKQDTGVDFDSSPVVHADQRVRTDQSQFSGELQFLGNAASERLKWLVGLYHFDEDITEDVDVTSADFFAGGTLTQHNVPDNKSNAAFGQLTYSITETLRLTGGVRYTHEKKKQLYNHGVRLPGFTVPLIANVTVTDSWESVTPKAGVEFDLTDDTMAYASYSQGFRSGGFNGRPANIETITSYDPEKLTSYEVGVKSEFADRRARLNVAGFYNQYQDIQTTLAVLTSTGPAVVTENGARARVYGAELELTALPVPALELSAAAGYLNAKYTEADARATVRPGDKLLSSPKWTLNLGADLTNDLGRAGTLRLHADYSYRSDFYFFQTGSAIDRQNGYGLVNVRATYAPLSKNWSVAVYGLNVFNTSYAYFRQDAFSSYGQAAQWPAPPASWGAELRVNF